MKNRWVLIFLSVFLMTASNGRGDPKLIPGDEEEELRRAAQFFTDTVLAAEATLMRTQFGAMRFIQSDLEALKFDGDKCDPVVRKNKITDGYLGCGDSLRLRNIYEGMEEMLAIRELKKTLPTLPFNSAHSNALTSSESNAGKLLPFAAEQVDKTRVAPPRQQPLPNMSKTDSEWEYIRDHQKGFEKLRAHLLSVVIEAQGVLADLMREHKERAKKFESPGG